MTASIFMAKALPFAFFALPFLVIGFIDSMHRIDDLQQRQVRLTAHMAELLRRIDGIQGRLDKVTQHVGHIELKTAEWDEVDALKN